MEIDTHISIEWIIGQAIVFSAQVVAFAIWINNVKNQTQINKVKLDEHAGLIKENTSQDTAREKELTDRLGSIDKKIDRLDILVEMIAEHLKIKVPKYN